MASFNTFGRTVSGASFITSDYILQQSFGPYRIPDGVLEMGTVVTITNNVGTTERIKFVGYEDGTDILFFERIRVAGWALLTNERPSGNVYIPRGNIITNVPYLLGDATFSNYGFRQGNLIGEFGGDFTLQGTGRNSGLDIQSGVHRVGDALTIYPFGGTAAGPAVDVTYRGYVIDDGNFYPIFEAADFGGNGPAQFIGTDETGSGNYTPGALIAAPFALGEPDEASFSNYGFRQGNNLTGEFGGNFSLRGFGLDVPDGVYRAGDTLTVQPFGGGGAVDVTYRGYVIDDGNFYPIFEAADFGGGGPAQFIGTSETGTGSYTSGNIITDTPLGIGVIAFADYGLRIPEGEGNSNLLNSQNQEIEFDQGIYTVGDNVDLRIITYSGTGDARGRDVQHLQGTFAGFDGDTGNPLFSNPRQQNGNDFENGRQLIAASVEHRRYTVPVDDIITDVAYETGETYGAGGLTFSVFGNHGSRQGDTDGPFALQGQSITVADGIYRVGAKVTIHISGRAISTTFIGYDIGDNGQSNPIFRPVFRDDAGLHYIGIDGGTNEPGSGDYKPDNIVTDTPLRLGVITFADYGLRIPEGEGNSNLLNSQDQGIEFDHGLHAVGNTVELRILRSNGTVEQTITAEFAGFDGETGNPLFSNPRQQDGNDFNNGRQIIAASVEQTRYTVPVDDIITDVAYETSETYGTGGLTFSVFDNHGTRQGDTDGPFALQEQSVTVPDGLHRAGDEVTIHISGQSISTTFVGYDIGDNGDFHLIFRDDAGLHYIGTDGGTDEPGSGDYTPDNIVTDTPLRLGDVAAFSNYGFRQKDNLTGDFTLRGSDLDIPDGAYRVGDTLTIQPLGGVAAGPAVGVTFVGHVVSSDGTNYPIFEAADFGGNGPAQFIGTDEPSETASYAVAPGDLITDTPYATGVAMFADYGLRIPEGEGDSDLLNSQDLLIEFDHDVYSVDDMVELRILNPDGTVHQTINAEFAGYDRETGYPLFSNARQQNGNDFGSGRQIIAASEKARAYDVPVTDIVAEAWPPATTFANYGFRQEADLDGDFTLQGTGPLSGLDIPDGVYKVDDTLTIQPYGGAGAGPAVAVTYVGHVVGSDGTNYPIFEAADFGGNGRARFIGTNEPDETATYAYAPGDLVTDALLEVGVAEFNNFGTGGNQDGTGAYTLDGNKITLAHGIYRAGDNGIMLTASDGKTWTGQFVGFENLTGNPIFRVPASQGQQALSLIATNQPGTGTYTVPDGGIITDVAYETDETYGTDGITFSVFGNHGTRQGGPDGPFALQDESVTVADGIHRMGAEVAIHVSGREISTTFIGYDIGDDGDFHLIFRDDAGLHYIATDEPGSGDYTPDNIVTDAPLRLGGEVTFSNYGFRQGNNLTGDFGGDFTLQGDGRNDGLDVEDGIYRVGGALTIQPFGGAGAGPAVDVTYRGYVVDDGDFYPIFEAADFGGNGRAQFIGTGETGSGDYTPGALVAAAYVLGEPPDDITATFANYGFRQGDLGGDFTLRGASLDIPDGAYRVGDTVTIQPFGGGGATEVTYRGYVIDDGDFYPIFEAADFGGDGPAQFIGTSETGTGNYTPGALITDIPYATSVAAFADYALRIPGGEGDTDILNSQDRRIELDHGIYHVGNPVHLRIITTRNGERAVEHTVRATFAGYDRETGDPLFSNPRQQNGNDFNNGRQIIAASVEQSTYNVPVADIVAAPYKIGVASTFSNYGFRQEADLTGDFTLQGDGRNDGLDIPDGVYEVGHILRIQPFGGAAAGPAVDVTFVGYVVSSGGTNYPIFEAADFDSDGDGIGNGPARFIGTDETGTGSYSTTPDDLVTDAPYKIGESTFTNYGIGDFRGQFTLQGTGPNSGLDIPNGIYREGETLKIQPFGGDAAGPAVEVTFRGYVVSSGGTNYPVFDTIGIPGAEPTQFIGTDETGTGSYSTTPGDLVTNAPYKIGESTFTNYGFRQGNNLIGDFGGDFGGDFTLQGTGPNSGLDIRDGVYRFGQTYRIQPFGGDAAGPAVTVTFRGYQRDTNYPIFEAANFNGNGRAQFIGTDETGTGSYRAGALITNAPYLVGDATFSNYGFHHGSNPDGFTLQGIGRNAGLNVQSGTHRAGDIVTIQPFGGAGAGPALQATFRGFVIDDDNFYPVFQTTTFRGNQQAWFIGTDETGTGRYSTTPDDLVTDTPYLAGEPTFSNFGQRGADDSDFALQERSIELDRGIYRAGDAVPVRIGGPGDITTTFVGFEAGTFYPILQLGSGRLIGTNETGSGDYTPGEIVTDAPYKLGGESTFISYGFRQEADLTGEFGGDFTLQGAGPHDGLDIQHGVHRAGDTLTIQPYGGAGAGPAVEATFLGHVVSSDGTRYPVFEAADFGGNGQPARFIGTRETGTGSYSTTPGDLVTDAPYALGDATFSNFGAGLIGFGQNQDGTGDYTLDGNAISLPHGLYSAGDEVVLTAGERTWTGQFVGFENLTGNPIFRAGPPPGFSGEFHYILTNGPGTGTYTVPDDGIITDVAYETDETYGTGAVTFSVFGNHGTRQGDPDGDFTLQDESVTVADGLYGVGDEVTLHISGRAISTTYIGYDTDVDDQSNPVFRPVFRDDAGLHYIGTDGATDGTGSGSTTPGALITAPYAVGEPDDDPAFVNHGSFTNYGFRQGNNLIGGFGGDFTLRGAGIRIPHDIYREGDTLTIQPFGGGGATAVTFVGHVVSSDGTDYPIFEAADFGGDGPAQFIGTSETGSGDYTPGALITDAPYKLGGESTFSNYGFRQEADLTGEFGGDFTLQGAGRNSGLDIPDGVHRVGETLTIQPYGGAGAGPTVDVTYVGHVVSSDGTNYPIFEAADFGGKGPARFIGTNEPDETATYAYAPGNLVTNTPYVLGDATFSNFGTGGNQDGTGTYTLDGNAITLPHGLYRAGDQVVLTAPGEGTTRTWTGQFVGFENLTGNAIFRVPASQGQQAFSLILTNRPGTGSHTVPDGGVITTVAYETDETYGTDAVTFSVFDNHGTRQGDTDGAFALQDESVTVADGLYGVDDAVTIHVSGQAISTTYIGYDIGDDGQSNPVFRPVFRDDAGLHYIATDEPGSGNYTPGDIITAPYAVGEPGDATFSNYGFRQGGNLNLDGDFTLRGSGLDIPGGVYEEGDTFTIQPFGKAGAVEVTFRGYVIDDGYFYPIFEAADFGGDGPALFIGTDQTGTGSYTPGDIVTDTSYELDFTRFEAVAYSRQDQFGNYRYALNTNGNPHGHLDIPNRVYGAGDIISVKGLFNLFDREVKFVGYEPGTNYPIFEVLDHFGLDAPRILLTNEPALSPGQAEVHYTPSRIITDPLELNFIRFDNVAILQGDGPAGTYILQDESRDIPNGSDDTLDGTYDVGDTTTIRFGEDDIEAELVGFQTDTNYPVFKAVDQVNGEDLHFLLTYEQGADGTSYALAGNEITVGTYTTCFAPGTLIATPAGERAVETLKPGDEVLTADGGVATVRFVGMQRVSTIFGPREVTHPVRILAGALGENTPHTDLVVTKDHGMILDGVICNAGALINGTSIIEVPTRELDTDPKGVVTWYHVETENHAALLANGAVAESFIDTVDRATFGNYSEFAAMYGSSVPAMTEMNMPRAMSIRQLPNRIKWRLIERAEAILAPVARSM